MLHLRVVFAEGETVDSSAFAGLDGVTLCAETDGGRGFEVTVAGPMDGLVKMLAGYRVESLETSKPGLEEVFLAYYGDGEGGGS